MHIVNPSGVKFTNKYLTWFRCLGLEDHSLGGAANGGKKAASNAKRYPLCKNKRIPFTRNPPVSCLLGRCPNPRRTQNLCSGTMDKSIGCAIFQIACGRILSHLKGVIREWMRLGERNLNDYFLLRFRLLDGTGFLPGSFCTVFSGIVFLLSVLDFGYKKRTFLLFGGNVLISWTG